MAIFNHKRINLLSDIRKTYLCVYPKDPMGKMLKYNITFAEILASLIRNEGFYNTIFMYNNISDTLVRERIFEMLACVTGFSYDKIYSIWINKK